MADSKINELINHGKQNGKLTTKEITDVLEELDFDADEINKHYGELVGWTMVDGRRRSIRGTSTYEKTRQNANKYFSKLIEASNGSARRFAHLGSCPSMGR